MMNEKDLKEYEDNIKMMQKIKKSNKFNYIQGKQITDEKSGKRVYENRLQMKNQENEFMTSLVVDFLL